MLSVITPTNNTRYLGEAHDSLAGQTHTDWEWIVVPNGGATWASDDPRVRVIPADFTGSVGGLKRFACQQAKGDLLVELDHDDLLTPTALAQIADAFEDAEVGMVYSNCAEIFLPGGQLPKVGENFLRSIRCSFSITGLLQDALDGIDSLVQARRRVVWGVSEEGARGFYALHHLGCEAPTIPALAFEPDAIDPFGRQRSSSLELL